MITDCPECFRQFRVYAWQLTAAQGLVQCGYCSNQFNALTRLHDTPLLLSETKLLEPINLTNNEIDEPQFEIPVNNPITREARFEGPEDKVVEQSGESLDSNKILNSELKSVVEDLFQEELSLELSQQIENPQSIWSTIFWTIGVLSLIFIILIQLAWFNRDWLLGKYPQYRPMARQICEQYGCQLIRNRDLASIVLLNRDVRDHPRYRETLLVNATIENQANTIQPYPGIRLILYDTDGEIAGYRIFKPPEYLDSSIDIAEGMPTGVPVHLVLEMTGATEISVSFEFHFI
jgi:predicted Zn finger-like uncharacterized protein